MYDGGCRTFHKDIWKKWGQKKGEAQCILCKNIKNAFYICIEMWSLASKTHKSTESVVIALFNTQLVKSLQ